jgi:hypothetical protein
MFDKMMVRGLMTVALRPTMISMALVLIVSAVARGDTITLNNSGEGSVTIPAGQQWIDVEVQCWGGGGGGSDGSIWYSGGGGGGGAYAYGTYTSLPSGTYNYYIGMGGPASALNANPGGSTIWNYGGAQDIYVTGGGGGGGTGNGGSPGLVLAGTGYQGGAGGNGYQGDMYHTWGGGGGGGSAGPSGPGGGGGNGDYTQALYGYLPYGGNGGNGDGGGGNGAGPYSATAGSFPGGGGGGGFDEDNISASGANGEITITYTAESVPEPSTLTLLATGAIGLITYRWRKRATKRTIQPDAQDEAPAILAFPPQSSCRIEAKRRAA